MNFGVQKFALCSVSSTFLVCQGLAVNFKFLLRVYLVSFFLHFVCVFFVGDFAV